jgi:hypothetical protein
MDLNEYKSTFRKKGGPTGKRRQGVVNVDFFIGTVNGQQRRNRDIQGERNARGSTTLRRELGKARIRSKGYVCKGNKEARCLETVALARAAPGRAVPARWMRAMSGENAAVLVTMATMRQFFRARKD